MWSDQSTSPRRTRWARTVVVALVPILGVIAGLLTNLITTAWSWTLMAALIGCLVAGAVGAIFADSYSAGSHAKPAKSEGDQGESRSDPPDKTDHSTQRDNLSLARLRRLTASQFEDQVALLVGDPTESGPISDRKYIPEVFVARATVQSVFAEFRDSPNCALAIAGDAGLGKTNILCYEATESRRKDLVLFYRGAGLGNDLRSRMLEDLHEQDQRSFRDLVEALDEILISSDLKLYVFIDAINEASIARAELRADIEHFVNDIKGSRVRLIISCRTLDWNYWIRDAGGLLNSLGRACRWLSDRDNQIESAIALGVLSSSELDEAWDKYQRHFQLLGYPSKRMRQLCREPFMLRLVAEVYRNNKPIPDYVHPLELFERYVAEKFSPPSAHVEYYHFLHWLGQQMIDSRRPWVPIQDMDPSNEKVCRSLLDENVIIFERSGRVQFHFELFMEFIVARTLIAHLPRSGTVEQKLATLRALTMSDFVNAPGVAENLLLYWQQNTEVFAKGLQLLVANDDERWDRWRTIACSVLRKADVSPTNLVPVIRTLAKDANYVIRLFVADVLGHDPSSTARGGLCFDLAADAGSWETRETSANAFAAARNDAAAAAEMVWLLTDDYHWRVRRAAGYALHDLWDTDTEHARSHKEHVLAGAGETTWRQKYALCAALYGTDLNEDNGARVVIADVFAHDSNSQVRWAVANYLSRYRYSEMPVLVQGLVEDPDPWIRSRMVSTLVGRSRQSSSLVTTVLTSLAADTSSAVRLTVARELRWAKPSTWLEGTLSVLARDHELDVAFASQYTLHTLGLQPLDQTDGDMRSLALRERVARCEIDTALARFAPVERYILRRAEFIPREDSFMRLIDSMSTIIASSSHIFSDECERSRFMSLILGDQDESVRWALVMYLVDSFASDNARQCLDLFTQLAHDKHWWIRREVATGLRVSAGGEYARQALDILDALVTRELSFRDDCSDEVLHFAVATSALLARDAE